MLINNFLSVNFICTGDQQCDRKNVVLRRIFRSKAEEVMEQWEKLHNKELHHLYFSLSVNSSYFSLNIDRTAI
jgi:hypothetical protein